MADKPYWWPELADDAWRARIRSDYPDEAAAMDDDEIDDTYNEGGTKYVDMWDHLGDARESYEQLADAFLRLVAEAGKTPADFKS